MTGSGTHIQDWEGQRGLKQVQVAIVTGQRRSQVVSRGPVRWDFGLYSESSQGSTEVVELM